MLRAWLSTFAVYLIILKNLLGVVSSIHNALNLPNLKVNFETCSHTAVNLITTSGLFQLASLNSEGKLARLY